MTEYAFDPQTIRPDFPILKRQVHGHPLVYLDNAATSQKPQVVIDAITDFYQNHNANIHRGVHTLSDESTQLYEEARATISRFIGARHPEELIFVRNTTEAINLVAFSWALKHLQPEDEILVTELEHHSNLLPWQRVCQQTGARLVHLPITQNGDLALDYLETLVGQRTKLVALPHVSNVLGTTIDIYHFIKTLKRHHVDAKILVDGAQSTPHLPVNVAELNVDFFAFSGHKMLGPMGIGGLYVKKSVLETLDPFLLGGGMIKDVTKKDSSFADLPDRFDAGTPNVAGAVGLAVACDYLSNLGLVNIHQHELNLTAYAIEQLKPLQDQGLLTLYGPLEPPKRGGIVTFNLTNTHSHDVAQILDRQFGIAVRSGHHCNQVILKNLGCQSTVRASFYLYNTTQEIDLLIQGLQAVYRFFQK